MISHVSLLIQLAISEEMKDAEDVGMIGPMPPEAPPAENPYEYLK